MIEVLTGLALRRGAFAWDADRDNAGLASASDDVALAGYGVETLVGGGLRLDPGDLWNARSILLPARPLTSISSSEDETDSTVSRLPGDALMTDGRTVAVE